METGDGERRTLPSSGKDAIKEGQKDSSSSLLFQELQITNNNVSSIIKKALILFVRIEYAASPTSFRGEAFIQP
jgi:hypothetical protein